MVLAFKNVGKRSIAKIYCLVSLLSVVSEVFEKLLNNRIIDHLEKCVFSDFQYGFRSWRSTVNLLTVVSDIIARAFNRSGATWAVALDLSKAFDRSGHTGLLRKCLMEFQVRYLPVFRHFSVIDGFRWFWMENLENNIQLLLEFPNGPFLVLHFSNYTLMTFLTKTQLVLFDQSNNTGAIAVKMDGSVLEEKLSFKMLGLTSSSKLDWVSYIISIA